MQVDENSFVNLLLKFFPEFLHFGHALNAKAHLFKWNEVSNRLDLFNFVFERLDCASVLRGFQIFVPQINLHAEVINVIECNKLRVRDFELLANASNIEELAFEVCPEIQDSSPWHYDHFGLLLLISVFALVPCLSIGPFLIVLAALLGLSGLIRRIRRIIWLQSC